MTMASFGVIVAAAAVASLVFLVARAWLEMRGTRLVTCPDNRQPVAVELDMRYALATAAGGRPELRLRECTRWPERKGCGQMCLSEIEAAPHDCLVREVLGRWYDGKSCAFCGRGIGALSWHDHKPALKAADDRIWEWGELPPEQLPAVLAGSRAVCWNCMVAEGFRREHADLVIERPRVRRLHRHA